MFGFNRRKSSFKIRRFGMTNLLGQNVIAVQRGLSVSLQIIIFLIFTAALDILQVLITITSTIPFKIGYIWTKRSILL